MRKAMSLIAAVLIFCSVFSSVSVEASAGLFDITKTGTMSDTSAPDNGTINWSFTYNRLEGEAKLVLSGNGYMPNGTDDSWFVVQAASGCYITELVIHEGVKSIMSGAFNGEMYLTSVDLPDSLERIGESAFAGTAITSVTIPEKVEYFEGSMFNNAVISEYSVSENNPYYSSKDGVVYSKDGTTLVAYPTGRFTQDENHIFNIPENVTAIGEYAFFNSEAVSVTIPSNVKYIGKQAFAGNTMLTNLVIENGVERIFDGAFLACSSLKEIHLPASVNYLGFYSFGFNYEIAYDGVEELLDEQGIEHEEVTAENIYYYTSLMDYTPDQFVYCFPDKTVTLYAPKNSVGHNYAARFGLGYVQSQAITPKLLGAVSVNGGVKLTWSRSTDAVGYRVYRKNKKGSWVRIADINKQSTTTYIDKGAFSNYKNIYTVRAVGEQGLSTYNKQGVSVYYVPTPALKSIANTGKGVKVTWGAVKGTKKYNIYRKAGSATKWDYIARVDGKVTSYVDTEVSNGVTYTYTVRAVDANGISSYNSTGLKLTFVTSPKISAASNTASGVKLKWNKISGATKYRLYRKTGNGSWVTIATVGSSVTSYTDKTAKSGVTYRYTVRACNGTSWSSYYSGQVIKFLSTPADLTAKSTKSGVVVGFKSVKGATSYAVYRRTSTTGSWTRIATVKNAKATSYTDKTAKKGVTYYYTVKAFNGSYKSSHSANGVKIKDKY